MFCVEFDLRDALHLSQEINEMTDKNTLSEEDWLASQARVIDQDMVDNTLFLYINGDCHGQRVLTHDLRFQLNGKKIVKSV